MFLVVLPRLLGCWYDFADWAKCIGLFGALDVGPARAVYGELSWLTSDFYGARGFQGIDRLDRQWVATLGVEARDWPAEGWSTGPQLRFTDNASNVPVFEFDRLEVSVFVRRALR